MVENTMSEVKISKNVIFGNLCVIVDESVWGVFEVSWCIKSTRLVHSWKAGILGASLPPSRACRVPDLAHLSGNVRIERIMYDL